MAPKPPNPSPPHPNLKPPSGSREHLHSGLAVTHLHFAMAMACVVHEPASLVVVRLEHREVMLLACHG